MQGHYVADLFAHLQAQGFKIESGLSDAEVENIERVFSFRFPPDLKALLQLALPISSSFVDWRHASQRDLQRRFDWPLEGIFFDIEHANFWLPEWGTKPLDLHEAFQIARQQIQKAPILIPVYSHRYLPAEPSEAQNPVFSVYQTDIIYYGFDLPSYFQQEFGAPLPPEVQDSPKRIRFWSQLAA